MRHIQNRPISPSPPIWYPPVKHNIFQTNRSNVLKIAAWKSSQLSLKNGKSMTADNDNYLKRFFFCLTLIKPKVFFLCLSWTACVTYNIYLNTKRIAPCYFFLKKTALGRTNSLFICSSVVRISLVRVMRTFFVRIAVKCQRHTNRNWDHSTPFTETKDNSLILPLADPCLIKTILFLLRIWMQIYALYQNGNMLRTKNHLMAFPLHYNAWTSTSLQSSNLVSNYIFHFYPYHNI